MPGYRDFYATLAQVLPVLLLTIVWDRDWLADLPNRRHGTGPDDVRLWTKPIVRWYTLMLTAVLLNAIGSSVLVLPGVLDDTAWLRSLLIAAAAMSLATLFVRIGAGVIKATDSGSSPPKLTAFNLALRLRCRSSGFGSRRMRRSGIRRACGRTLSPGQVSEMLVAVVGVVDGASTPELSPRATRWHGTGAHKVSCGTVLLVPLAFDPCGSRS